MAQVIIALDFATAQEAMELVDAARGSHGDPDRQDFPARQVLVDETGHVPQTDVPTDKAPPCTDFASKVHTCFDEHDNQGGDGKLTANESPQQKIDWILECVDKRCKDEPPSPPPA